MPLGFLMLQNLVPRNGELGLADTQTHVPSACPTQSACQTCCSVLHIAPLPLEQQLRRGHFIRIQNNCGKMLRFVPLGTYSCASQLLAARDSLLPRLLPSSSRTAPLCPGPPAESSRGCAGQRYHRPLLHQ